VLDWSEIDRHLAGILPAAKGEPGWPPLTLLRGLLVATWHGLSDVQLAEVLDDRASFRRLSGFAAHEPTPERTAFVRFRRELVLRGLDRALFEAVTRQLEAKGAAVRTGTLVDATLIPSPPGTVPARRPGCLHRRGCRPSPPPRVGPRTMGRLGLRLNCSGNVKCLVVRRPWRLPRRGERRQWRPAAFGSVPRGRIRRRPTAWVWPDRGATGAARRPLGRASSLRARAGAWRCRRRRSRAAATRSAGGTRW